MMNEKDRDMKQRNAPHTTEAPVKAMTIVNVPMDAEMRDDFVSWIYRNYNDAQNAVIETSLKSRIRFDPTLDGDQASFRAFQAKLRERAEKDLVKWRSRFEEFKGYSPWITEPI